MFIDVCVSRQIILENADNFRRQRLALERLFNNQDLDISFNPSQLVYSPFDVFTISEFRFAGNSCPSLLVKENYVDQILATRATVTLTCVFRIKVSLRI